MIFLEGVKVGNFYEFLTPYFGGLILSASLAVIGFGGSLVIRV